MEETTKRLFYEFDWPCLAMCLPQILFLFLLCRTKPSSFFCTLTSPLLSLKLFTCPHPSPLLDAQFRSDIPWFWLHCPSPNSHVSYLSFPMTESPSKSKSGLSHPLLCLNRVSGMNFLCLPIAPCRTFGHGWSMLDYVCIFPTRSQGLWSCAWGSFVFISWNLACGLALVPVRQHLRVDLLMTTFIWSCDFSPASDFSNTLVMTQSLLLTFTEETKFYGRGTEAG